MMLYNVIAIGLLTLGMLGWVAFYFSNRTIEGQQDCLKLHEDRHALEAQRFQLQQQISMMQQLRMNDLAIQNHNMRLFIELHLRQSGQLPPPEPGPHDDPDWWKKQ
jgi:hypothetical protein